MKVLCHGAPFCCDYSLLDAYVGPHDIRWLGIDPRAQYRFDALRDNANTILARLRREWKPDLLLCWTPEIYPPPSRDRRRRYPYVRGAGLRLERSFPRARRKI